MGNVLLRIWYKYSSTVAYYLPFSIPLIVFVFPVFNHLHKDVPTVTFSNVLHLAHVPMSLRARTSALDGWLRIIKVHKGWDLKLYDLSGCPR